MKQLVTIPHIMGGATRATIIIDKYGMRIVDKSESCSDSSVCRQFLSQLVDMDNWNYSWHMDVSKAQFKGSEERKLVRQILLDKIADREAEIQKLKNSIQILGRWNINTN